MEGQLLERVDVKAHELIGVDRVQGDLQAKIPHVYVVVNEVPTASERHGEVACAVDSLPCDHEHGGVAHVDEIAQIIGDALLHKAQPSRPIAPLEMHEQPGFVRKVTAECDFLVVLVLVERALEAVHRLGAQHHRDASNLSHEPWATSPDVTLPLLLGWVKDSGSAYRA